MIFLGDKLTQKETAKLLAWQRWEIKMRQYRRIKSETQAKVKAKRKAWQWLEGIGA